MQFEDLAQIDLSAVVWLLDDGGGDDGRRGRSADDGLLLRRVRLGLERLAVRDAGGVVGRSVRCWRGGEGGQ